VDRLRGCRLIANSNVVGCLTGSSLAGSVERDPLSARQALWPH
jgi:hypothetical protein